jgi:signal transduction histidine kinase/CheY-like chemotaxis protein
MGNRLSRQLSALVFGSCMVTGLLTGLWISRSVERDATAKLIDALGLTANRYESGTEREFVRKTNTGVAISELLQKSLVDPNAPRVPLELEKGADGALRVTIGEYGAYLAKRSEITAQIDRDIETLFYVGPQLGHIAAVDFHNFYFESAAGDFLFETPKDWPLEVKADEDFRPYFALVSPSQNPNRKPAWKPLYFDGIQNLWMTSLRVPLYDGDQFLGAVGFDYILESIFRSIREIDIAEGWCKAFLFDSSGNLVVHPDYMEQIQKAWQVASNEALLENAHRIDTGVASFIQTILADKRASLDRHSFDYAGEENYASVRTIEPLGWKMVVYSPRSTVTGPLRATQFTVIATTSLLAILLATGLNIGFRRIVLRRLAALANSAKRLGESEWDAMLPEIRDDEIGSLTSSFGEMSKKLRELVTGLEERVVERTDELVVARDAANAANQAKSVFLANMSHEIRTPMNAVLGFAQLLERDASLSPSARARVSTIMKSGEYLLSIINEVLEMSRIEAGRVELRPEPVDLHNLLDDLVAMFGLRAGEKGLSLTLDRAADVPRYIMADLGKLRQILINLLSNAVKYTQHGSIVVHVRPATHERIVIEVQDTGIGISGDEQKKLFQPFERTRSGEQTAGGTGLGLAISRNYAHLMSGGITIESRAGEGSCFRFEFLAPPTAQVPISTEPSRRITGLSPGQGEIRVLVVDDLPANRELLREMLAPLGFVVDEACDGPQAISKANSILPRIILIDLVMPGMNGIEATRIVRKTLPGESTVIIGLSASAFEEEKRAFLDAGLNAFIAKPFREQELFDALIRHGKIAFETEEIKVDAPDMRSGGEKPTLAMAPADWREAFAQALSHGSIAVIRSLGEAAKAFDPLLSAYILDRVASYDLNGLKGLRN